MEERKGWGKRAPRIKLTERGGVKVLAEPCVATSTQVSIAINYLVPLVGQAQAYVASRKGKVTPNQLRNVFKGTELDYWADDDDWETIIGEYKPKYGRRAQPKSIATAIISSTTALTPQTVKTYGKREKQKQSPTVPDNPR